MCKRLLDQKKQYLIITDCVFGEFYGHRDVNDCGVSKDGRRSLWKTLFYPSPQPPFAFNPTRIGHMYMEWINQSREMDDFLQLSSIRLEKDVIILRDKGEHH